MRRESNATICGRARREGRRPSALAGRNINYVTGTRLRGDALHAPKYSYLDR